MSDKTWKAKERMIARDFFGVERNPLSGRNNRSDDGTPRLGDVLLSWALIEIKTRKKNASLERAKETRKLAKENDDMPWLHIEMLNGSNKEVALIMSYEQAQAVAKYLKYTYWDRKVVEPIE